MQADALPVYAYLLEELVSQLTAKPSGLKGLQAIGVAARAGPSTALLDRLASLLPALRQLCNASSESGRTHLKHSHRHQSTRGTTSRRRMHAPAVSHHLSSPLIHGRGLGGGGMQSRWFIGARSNSHPHRPRSIPPPPRRRLPPRRRRRGAACGSSSRRYDACCSVPMHATTWAPCWRRFTRRARPSLSTEARWMPAATPRWRRWW